MSWGHLWNTERIKNCGYILTHEIFLSEYESIEEQWDHANCWSLVISLLNLCDHFHYAKRVGIGNLGLQKDMGIIYIYMFLIEKKEEKALDPLYYPWI